MAVSPHDQENQVGVRQLLNRLCFLSEATGWPQALLPVSGHRAGYMGANWRDVTALQSICPGQKTSTLFQVLGELRFLEFDMQNEVIIPD